MPVISMEVGKLTREQKVELIQKFTETASQITNIPRDAFTIVINELEDDNIGIGGQTIGELKKQRIG